MFRHVLVQGAPAGRPAAAADRSGGAPIAPGWNRRGTVPDLRAADRARTKLGLRGRISDKDFGGLAEPACLQRFQCFLKIGARLKRRPADRSSAEAAGGPGGSWEVWTAAGSSGGQTRETAQKKSHADLLLRGSRLWQSLATRIFTAFRQAHSLYRTASLTCSWRRHLFPFSTEGAKDSEFFRPISSGHLRDIQCARGFKVIFTVEMAVDVEFSTVSYRCSSIAAITVHDSSHRGYLQRGPRFQIPYVYESGGECVVIQIKSQTRFTFVDVPLCTDWPCNQICHSKSLCSHQKQPGERLFGHRQPPLLRILRAPLRCCL